MNAIETIEVGNRVAKIFYDEQPSNPRTEFDNFGTMICFHGRYNLGDKHNYKTGDFNGWDEMKKQLIKDNDPIVLPLYLYDHSGITISTGPFSCNWDSGQIGFILVSKEKVREEFKVKRISPKLRERVIKMLNSEVAEYDQYLTGDIYGYVIEDQEGEHIDSCWGFYGLDFIKEEVASLLKESAEEKVEC